MTGPGRDHRPTPTPPTLPAGPPAGAAIQNPACRGWPFIYWLFSWSACALATGAVLWSQDAAGLADMAWWAGTVPVLASLTVSMIAVFLAGRVGVDAIAFFSMAAALALSEAFAANVIAIMYAGGNVLETYAVGRAERDLSALTSRAPTHAHKISGSGIEDVLASSLRPGERLLVKPGEVIPVDGTVASADAQIDESAVTGEPLPVTHGTGERILSGTVNAGGAFEMSALATADESSYAGLIRLVGSAREERAPFVRMADRFAIFLLPFTLAVAGTTWWAAGDPVRGLAVLVVATPCPLILAAPVAFISGVSRTARHGVVMRGGRVIEALAEVKTAIFDKTGTLTEGGARLIGIETAESFAGEEVLRLAASLEQASHHALAANVVEAATLRNLALSMPADVAEFHGSGIEGIVEGQRVKIGTLDLVDPSVRNVAWIERGILQAQTRGALTVFVSLNGTIAGMLIMADRIRREAAGSLRWLRSLGIARTVMLTGDTRESAERVAAALRFDAIFAGCTPDEKLRVLREEAQNGPVLMVGDGINDAPSLAAAHVGIALGARGGSAASQSADAVLLVESIDRIPQAVTIARHTRRIARQSVVTGLVLSLVAMLFAAFGYLPPVAGALTQEAIDVAVIVNALRALGPVFTRGDEKAASDRIRAQQEHRAIAVAIERLQDIADRLDRESPSAVATMLQEAAMLSRQTIVRHEIRDDSERYAAPSGELYGRAVMTALGYAHAEIFGLASRLERIAADSVRTASDPALTREAQRLIDELATWVRLHNAIEDTLSAET